MAEVRRPRAGSVNWRSRAQLAWEENNIPQVLAMIDAVALDFKCPNCREDEAFTIFSLPDRQVMCGNCQALVTQGITINGRNR